MAAKRITVEAVVELMHNFSRTSTAHGLPRLARANSIFGRIFWATVCLASFSVFCYAVQLLVVRYYMFPKSVALEVSELPVDFPAVSVCNLRPLDVYTYGKFIYNERREYRWNLGEDFSYRGRDANSSTAPIFERNMAEFSNKYSSYFRYIEYLAELESDPVVFHNGYRQLLSRRTLAANLWIEAAHQGSTQKEEFVVLCEFAGEKCDHTNFTWFMDPGYFNCFTFDVVKFLNQHDYMTIHEGPDNGLSLVLFVPNVRTMNYTAEEASRIAINQDLTFGGEGARVVVHRQNTIPFPLSEGLDVPRGMSASIDIKQKEYSRLQQPHGNCTSKLSLDSLGNYTYTTSSCKKLCLQKLIIQQCGCSDVSLPIAKEDDDRSPSCAAFDNIPIYCRTRDDILGNFDQCNLILSKWFERIECMKRARFREAKKARVFEECNCVAPCFEREYEMVLSFSNWPVEDHSFQLMEKILHVERFQARFPKVKRDHYFGKLLHQSARVQDYVDFVGQGHFIRLNVYVSDTSIMRILETEAYGQWQLVSDIGGQMGLWIGVSVITCVELLELIMEVLHFMWMAEASNGRNVKKGDMQEYSYYGRAYHAVHTTEEMSVDESFIAGLYI